MDINRGTSHPHAEAMALYAQDAAKTRMPWIFWEVSDDRSDRQWEDLTGHPSWWHDKIYRRKPEFEPKIRNERVPQILPVLIQKREELNEEWIASVLSEFWSTAESLACRIRKMDRDILRLEREQEEKDRRSERLSEGF